MDSTINPKERFRKGFVLVLTIAYMIVFIATLTCNAAMRML